MEASSDAEGSIRIGWSTKSQRAWASPSALSRATAATIDSPWSGWVMLPTVVMPPSRAAARAAVEVVDPAPGVGRRAGRRQVDVEVDAAGQHRAAPGVDLDRRLHGPAELHDATALDADVGHGVRRGGDDRAPADDQIHPALLPVGRSRQAGVMSRSSMWATNEAGSTGSAARSGPA